MNPTLNMIANWQPQTEEVIMVSKLTKQADHDIIHLGVSFAATF